MREEDKAWRVEVNEHLTYILFPKLKPPISPLSPSPPFHCVGIEVRFNVTLWRSYWNTKPEMFLLFQMLSMQPNKPFYSKAGLTQVI